MSATILVLGRSGQVARELAKIGPPKGFVFEFAGRDRLDLATEDPRRLIEEIRPAAVINAAAHTAVDQAESEPEAAFRLNRDVPAVVAKACAQAATPFVHFSTDFVFDGAKAGPYVETDAIGPLNVYGASKAAGEAEVLAAGGPAVILRISWVFGAHGVNFLRRMLQRAESQEEIGVVADQLGRPTWAEDCACGSLRALEALMDGTIGRPELFHLSGLGDASVADLTEAIFAESAARGGRSARVRRITTAERPTPARRPANSRLDCSKIGRVLDWPLRDWREGLSACFDEMDRLAEPAQAAASMTAATAWRTWNTSSRQRAAASIGRGCSARASAAARKPSASP